MLRNGPPGPVIIAVPNPAATNDETLDPYRTVKTWKSVLNYEAVSSEIKKII